MKYNIEKLCDILSYVRWHGSRGEMAMIREYLDSIPGMQSDSHGNRIIQIGRTSTMFTSHTDTVHSTQDRRIKRPVYITQEFVHTDHKTILGADDGTGVWLMLNMIGAKVPGYYIFQRAEEIGGLGSTFSSKKKNFPTARIWGYL